MEPVHIHDYRPAGYWWRRPAMTVTTVIRHVLCLECGKIVATIRTNDVDEVAKKVRRACREHRLNSRHTLFRILDGQVQERQYRHAKDKAADEAAEAAEAAKETTDA